MEAATATDIEEAQLTRWLFTGFAPIRQLALKFGLTPGTQLYFGADPRTLWKDARGPGDIDVLAIDPARPEYALAIEVKRVKMPASSYWTSMPNKLEGIDKGREQVERLRQIGFHRNYLLIAVVADGRERADVNFASRGPTPELIKAVRGKLHSLEFHPDVGVVVVEVTQPVDKDICDAGAVGIWTHQEGNPVPQNPEVSRSIRNTQRGV